MERTSIEVVQHDVVLICASRIHFLRSAVYCLPSKRSGSHVLLFGMRLARFQWRVHIELQGRQFAALTSVQRFVLSKHSVLFSLTALLTPVLVRPVSGPPVGMHVHHR